MPDHLLAPYDALVVASFGGPEGPDEVMPFLRRVTAGRGVPDDRLEEVAEHYHLFGGVSPINAQNRALVAALEGELDRRGAAIPVRLGNRNSAPYLRDTLADLGQARVLVLLTSPYQSYSSCRQYREDLAEASAGLPVRIDKVRPYADHPAVRAAMARLTIEAIPTTAPGAVTDPSGIRVIGVAHSIPTTMDQTSGSPTGPGAAYSRGVAEVIAAVTEAVNEEFGLGLSPDVAWCSRSGPPSQPWLEPDIGDRIEELAGAGARTVVIAPVGFVSDHMEVIFDLDTEARERAEALGVTLVRAGTVGTDPDYVAALADLALDRAAEARGEFVPTDAVPPSRCAVGCCPNPRVDKPAACGQEADVHA